MTFIKRMIARFLGFNIAQKMYLGFLPLVIFLVLFSTFALVKLNQLRNLNESILTVNIPIQETIRQMNNAVIDQESILRRFIILRDNGFLSIFNDNRIEFSDRIHRLRALAGKAQSLDLPFSELEKANGEYLKTLLTGMESPEERTADNNDYNRTVRLKQSTLLDILAEIDVANKADRDRKVGVSASISGLAFKFALTLCAIGIVLSTICAAGVTRNIVNAVKKLHHATEEIALGRFNQLPDIKNRDELGDLAKAFVRMGRQLKNFEETYLDANPLTRLPGGIAIENMLTKRIETEELFAFCLLDIDNFKSFNDRYGYTLGNEMIRATATIIKESTARHGADDDFIGHIGGDDFVVISRPDKYQTLCRTIIREFDEKIPTLYSEDDRKRGYIAGKNRQGEEVTFPLATISIAAVTNRYRIIDTHIKAGEIAAEIKEYSKSIIGSSMVADHRTDRDEDEKGQGKLLSFPKKMG
ncbi:MAG: diguanylate cyclase [Desulfurivibrionaceae bacterium]|nr:diguanylate cyclase [Desulfurivibrionaceae bacterium]